MRIPSLATRLAALVSLAVFSGITRGAERIVFHDGRELLFDARQKVEGGWIVSLVEGGSFYVPAGHIQGFAKVDLPLPDPRTAAAPGGEVCEPPEAHSVQGPESLADLVDRIAREHSVDPRLVEAVVHVESAFNPNAVSPKGAAGLMQLMPGTAGRYEVADVFDPVENVRGGVLYLKELMTRFNGDFGLALAAYNAGEGAVARYTGIPPYRETRRYVIKVLERYLSR